MSRRYLGVAAALLLAAAPALAQIDHGFMPKGGNVLLQQLLAQAPAAELQSVLGEKHTEAEWQAQLAPRTQSLSEQERRTLAAYLASNLPLPADTAQHATAAGLASLLPPDGDELAWQRCGSCHSLFTGYLMQERDVKGWLAIFLSPFHRGIKMTQQERATFAGYSAINMPVPRDKVPPDMRY